MDRVVRESQSDDVAFRRLGVATVLRWSELPTSCQEMIVQQALALSGGEDEVRTAISRIAETRGHAGLKSGDL